VSVWQTCRRDCSPCTSIFRARYCIRLPLDRILHDIRWCRE